MTEQFWSKFWWKDWQADQALRSCSLAARGLWMDMLCIANSGTPRGHLTINGAPVSTKRMATLTGASEREVSRLINELREAGVFSETPEGTIFCRRMVRDNQASEAGRGAISKRWEKRSDPISPPNRGPTREPDSPPTSLEAESEAEAESKIYKSYLKPRVASAVPVERQEEGPPQAQWPPDPHPSAVTARVGQVATLLRKNARAGPAPPARTVEEQLAALKQSGSD